MAGRLISRPAVLALALLASACAHTGGTQPASSLNSAPQPVHPAPMPAESEWLKPPLGSGTYVLPSGDPAARDLPDDQSDLPPVNIGVLNTNPQRKYRIHGRKPPGYEVMFASRFRGYRFWTPECQALMRAQEVHPDFQGEFFRRMSVWQNETRYEATLVIDRFEDDACQWVYQLTDIFFATQKAVEPSDPQGIVLAGAVAVSRYYHTDDEVMPCPPDRPRCNPAALAMNTNASDEPVIVRCQTFPDDPATEMVVSWFSCQDFNRAYKRVQMLKSRTRDIRVDVYDLDVDPDPIEGWPNPPSAFPRTP